EDDNLVDGDYISIESYTYENHQGDERHVELPNPIRFIHREEKFGGFGLAYAKIRGSKQFEINYFGEPNMATVTSSNFTLRVSSVFNDGLFETAAILSIDSITHEVATDDQTDGKFLIQIDNTALVDITSTDSYLSIQVSTAVLSVNAKPVQRRKHVLSNAMIYEPSNTIGIVKSPDSNIKWLDVREDDFGYKSEPYLKNAATINNVSFVQSSEFSNEYDKQSFIEFDYVTNGSGWSYRGIGASSNLDPARNYFEIPQTNDFDVFDSSYELEDVYVLPNGARVGNQFNSTYRVGSSFTQESASGDFGNDYRAKVVSNSTILRVLPSIKIGDLRFENAVEVRVVEKRTWPTNWNDEGIATEYSTENYDLRTRRFWIASGHGVVFSDERNSSVSEFDQGSTSGHSWGQKTKTVAYRVGSNPPIAGNVSVEKLKLNEEEDLGFDSVHVEVEFGQGAKLYKLVVERPDHTTSEGYIVDTTITADIANENALTEYSFIEFDVEDIDSSTANIPWRFKVYEFELGTAANDMLVVTDTPLVADIPVIINGKRPHVAVHVEVRGEGEAISNILFVGSGFSFLAGQHLGFDDDKADIVFDKQEFGNGFVISSNPTLPNGEASGRYLANVFIEGNDMKEKFTNLVSNQNSLSLANVVVEDEIEPIPGQTYLYFGPGIQSMKDTGSDKVIAVIGITHVDEENFGFVYLLKNILGDELSLDFQGLSVNNNLGFQVVEDHYAKTVRLQGFRSLNNGQRNKIDLNIVGDAAAVHASVITSPEIFIHVNQDGSAYTFSKCHCISDIYSLTNEVDGFQLPTAMNPNSMNPATVVTTGEVFSAKASFILSHANGNHSLVSVFPRGSDVGGVTSSEGFSMSYITLVDNVSEDRWIQYQDDFFVTRLKKDLIPLEVHPVLLDFSLTGQEYEEISDINKVKLEIEIDRTKGDFSIFPANGVLANRLKGANVFAKFNLDELIDSFKIDTFNGNGFRLITKEQANEEVNLGGLNFNSNLNGKFSFDFIGEDLSRFRGQKIRLAELSWVLPSSSTIFKTTDINVIFEFNDQPQTPVTDFGSGMKLLSVKSVITTDEGKFVEFIFDKDLADDIYEYPYLISITEHVEYDPVNTGTNDTADQTMPSFIQPIEIHGQANVMRAYFSPTDESVIFHPEGNFDLSISQDFGDFQPKGIKSIDGKLLAEIWMRFGNKKLFVFDSGFSNFLPISDGDSFVYDVDFQYFEEFQEGESRSLQAVTSYELDGNVFTLYDNKHDEDNRKILQEFKNDAGVLQWTDGRAVRPYPLFTSDTTLGSALYLPQYETSARLDEIFNKYWLRGVEYSNVALFSVNSKVDAYWDGSVKPAFSIHKYAFSEGIGLISHTQEIITTDTFEVLVYKNIDLKGYKVGNKQGGDLEGIAGIEFNGVGVKVDLIVPSTFQAPYSIKFFQLIDETTAPILLEYDLRNDSSLLYTVDALEILNQGQNVADVNLPAFHAVDHPNGVNTSQNQYKLMAQIEDRNGVIEERNIVVSKFQQNLFWVLDLTKQSTDAPRLDEVDRAAALLDKRSIQDVESAHQIALAMKAPSQTLETQNQGHLIYAITNLASHLATGPDSDIGLGQLLDKLNFEEVGRNVFDFTSKMIKNSDDSLSLGDLQGLYDLQSYFVDGDTSLLFAISKSIQSLDFILQNSSFGLDEIMMVTLHDETTRFQVKDIYALKAGMQALSFALNYLSAHNLDMIKSTRDNLFTSDGETAPIATVTSFADALEYVSKDENSNVVDQLFRDEKLLDVFKDEASQMLAFRDGSGAIMNNAKLALMNSAESAIRFMDILLDNQGGSTGSAFYMKENELEDAKEQKKVLLSIWNNLSGAYHPDFTIDGKSGDAWYNLNVEGDDIVQFTFESNDNRLNGFDLSYVYTNSNEEAREWRSSGYPTWGSYYLKTPYKKKVFTKIRLATLFDTSYRDLLLNDKSFDSTTIASVAHFEDEKNYYKSIKKLLNVQTLDKLQTTQVVVGKANEISLQLRSIFTVASVPLDIHSNPTAYNFYIQPAPDIRVIYPIKTPTEYEENIFFTGSIIGEESFDPRVFIEDKTDVSNIKYYSCRYFSDSTISETNAFFYCEESTKSKLGINFEKTIPAFNQAITFLEEKTNLSTQAARQLGLSMKAPSQTLETQKKGHVIYAITNLAAHLVDSPTQQDGLGGILDKLNFSTVGRNIFNFTSALTKAQNGVLQLGDLQGIFDLQAYFVDGTNSLLSVLNDSIDSLDFVLENSGDGIDTVMVIELNNETTILQKKDIYLVKSAMNALSFALNYISAHDLDVDSAQRDKLFTPSGSAQVIAGVNSFAKAIEYVSDDANASTVDDLFVDEKLLDAFKSETSNLLGFRNNSAQVMQQAKQSLMDAIEGILYFLDIAKGQNGGSKSTAFYMDSKSIKDILEQKKSLLSLWNNLNRGYHPNFTVEGKSDADWYNFDVKDGEVAQILNGSTEDKLNGFTLDYVYGLSRYPFSIDHPNYSYDDPRIERSFYKVNFASLFDKSYRELLLNDGSVAASTITTLDYFSDSENLSSSLNSILSVTSVDDFVGVKTLSGKSTYVNFNIENKFFNIDENQSEIKLFESPESYKIYIQPSYLVNAIYLVPTPQSAQETIVFTKKIVSPSGLSIKIVDMTVEHTRYLTCFKRASLEGFDCREGAKFDFLK
ncbi:MAG: hypothetical protein KC646_17570, partial [Candidatus Cloacimonetes bacterium]|nr:hypothetical protein [Candidatus Cloacimonadota bacterium]